MIAVASSAAAQSELVGGVDPMRPLLRLVLIGALTSVVLGALPGSPETHRRPIETHHSLHHPFDQSSVYWKYGGSTVMTTKAIRLTPATQSRTGWLWNDYPVESANWEVEVSGPNGIVYATIDDVCRSGFGCSLNLTLGEMVSRFGSCLPRWIRRIRRPRRPCPGRCLGCVTISKDSASFSTRTTTMGAATTRRSLSSRTLTGSLSTTTTMILPTTWFATLILRSRTSARPITGTS